MNLVRFGEYFVEETRGDMRHGSWFWGRWGMMNSVEGCEGDDCDTEAGNMEDGVGDEQWTKLGCWGC